MHRLMIPVGNIFSDEISNKISLNVRGRIELECSLCTETNIFSIKEVISKDKDNLLILTVILLKFKDNILLIYGFIVSTFNFCDKSISSENTL